MEITLNEVVDSDIEMQFNLSTQTILSLPIEIE